MAVITPLTWPEKIGQDKVVVAYSDASDNISAIREIDGWARDHGYVRSREASLNIKQDQDGHRYYYSACYLLDEGDVRAAQADLARMQERRERMPVTASSAELRRGDE